MTERRGYLSWGVRSSFSAYVMGSGGDIAVDGHASDTGRAYVFPHVNSVRSEDGFVLQFTGSVRFRAHAGLMDVSVDSPWIHLGPNTLQLGVTGTEQTRTVDRRLLLAELRIREINQSGVVFESVLASEGAAVFDFHYPAGTEMDLLTLSGIDSRLFDEVCLGKVDG